MRSETWQSQIKFESPSFPHGNRAVGAGGKGPRGYSPPPLFLGEQQPYLNQGGGGGADYAHHDITFPLLLIFRSSYGPVYPLSDHLHGF